MQFRIENNSLVYLHPWSQDPIPPPPPQLRTPLSPTGVVVSFMNAGFGGSIQPRKKRKSGWLPKGIMDSMTQKMALSCRSRYSRIGMYSSL